MPTQEGFNHFDLMLWLAGLGVTLSVFVVSSVFGCLLGTLMAIGRYYQVAVLGPLLFAIGEILRNSPVIVQLFLVYFGIPMFFGIRITQFEAAILVLTANTAAFMSVVGLSALESVDREQVLTARSFALNEIDILRRILAPQALIVALPLTIGVLVNQAQVTSLISVIGVADLTRVGHILNQKTFEPFIVWPLIGATYLAISLGISALGKHLHNRIKKSGPWINQRESFAFD
ncbi:MAG: amino acid ABC transporter permease [Woeseiaceae bacterium]